jgi:hypothetical protein
VLLRESDQRVHFAIGSERHVLSKQLPPLLIRSVGQIRKLSITPDHTISQPPMAIVSGANQ